MKAARALVLGLGLAPFLLRLTCAQDTSGVGIVDVHPICDSSTSECISSDEQAKDEIMANLAASGQVTGEQTPMDCPCCTEVLTVTNVSP